MDEKRAEGNLFTVILSNFLWLIKQPHKWFQVHKFPSLKHFFSFSINIGAVTIEVFFRQVSLPELECCRHTESVKYQMYQMTIERYLGKFGTV